MALTLTNTVSGGNVNPPGAVTAPGTVAVGDLIVISVQLFSSTANTATVSDTVNSGNYTAIGSPLVDATGNIWFQWFYKVCNAAGTPVVSCTLGTNESGHLFYGKVTGFTGTPTLDAAMVANFHSASGTTVAVANPNTAQNNEIVLLAWKSGSTLTGTPTGWTATPNGSGSIYDLIAATSGTAAAFNGTLTASSYYNATVVGIYDAASVAPGVSSVNGGSSIAEGATAIAVVGTNLTNATFAITQPGGVSVAQTIGVAWGATGGNFDLVVEPGSGSQLAFTDATYVTDAVATTGGGSSAPLAVTITPPSGLIFQTLASINPSSSFRITAIPDLAIGDQLEASANSSGTAPIPTGLSLNSDATFQFANGDTPQSFWVRAYDGTAKTWGAWADQSVSTTTGLPDGGFMVNIGSLMGWQ